MGAIAEVEKQYLRTDVAEFGPGDTVIVKVRIKEGEKQRIQAYEGVVIRVRGGGTGKTFTVRKISYGVGVERVFPMHSPMVESVKVKTKGKVRRARLYYLRDLRGKAARVKVKR
ncbi:MAG: 50S ribosomal protein L19 [Deltaproteobacteria bacterium]|nr:50S ribosomal protein L19 [Deltaproteobacteria bacterium]